MGCLGFGGVSLQGPVSEKEPRSDRSADPFRRSHGTFTDATPIIGLVHSGYCSQGSRDARSHFTSTDDKEECVEGMMHMRMSAEPAKTGLDPETKTGSGIKNSTWKQGVALV